MNPRSRARERPVVAIDGPAGAGKSSAALALAARLNFVRIDSGALYRAIALEAQRQGTAWSDEPGVTRIAQAVDLRYEVRAGVATLLLDGADCGEALRTPEISQGASQVSRFRAVREALLGIQRALGETGGVVLEGRDIGTVVFPDAEVKVFLTASPEERARRRLSELQQRGIEEDYAQTLHEIRERDERDQTRQVAPLLPADDAITLDATHLSLDDVVDQLEALVRSRLAQ